MPEHSFLAEQFEAHRAHLHGVAYRVLASSNEADDAVQEAWLRLQRADANGNADGVENLCAWLTTVVARVSLDMLRARQSRREESWEERGLEVETRRDASDPEREFLLAESVGLAMMVVLDRLSPAERLAFVLHDMFALPFDEIAEIIECSAGAARQLASRARRRVQRTPEPDADNFARQREVAAAFLAAARDGDFEALLRVLAPDVVLRADASIAPPHGREVHGARKVAGQAIAGRAANARQSSLRDSEIAQLALLDGKIGIVVAPLGRLRLVLELQIQGDTITSIHTVADPVRLQQMDLAVLGASLPDNNAT